jgi:hypothetical protein
VHLEALAPQPSRHGLGQRRLVLDDEQCEGGIATGWLHEHERRDAVWASAVHRVKVRCRSRWGEV